MPTRLGFTIARFNMTGALHAVREGLANRAQAEHDAKKLSIRNQAFEYHVIGEDGKVAETYSRGRAVGTAMFRVSESTTRFRKKMNTARALDLAWKMSDLIPALEQLTHTDAEYKHSDKTPRWTQVDVRLSDEEIKLLRAEADRSKNKPLVRAINDLLGAAA